ncbi:MAG TPA: nucleotidyltransferase domain-containing protein [Burkholderiaceae bacterium]|nr:nucleotidyltransferase domain-containing protein [Burkholderiaceae bacterium]
MPLPEPSDPHAASALRRGIAQRVADAHEPLLPGAITAMVFGSTGEGLADIRSDIDMSIVFEQLPDEAELAAACRSAGGSAWTWQSGNLHEEGLAVSFPLDGVEVQVVYIDPRILQADLDELLVQHKPDTLNHKVAEGLLKAQPLIAPERVDAWRTKVAAFPPALGDAMMRHYLAEPTPWRWFGLMLHRDAQLWSRQLLVEAGYRLFGVLAGLNRCYFTTYQFKRARRFAAHLAIAPPQLVDRIEALLVAPQPEAFTALYALDGEVLALLAEHAPQIDLSAPRDRRTRFSLTSTTR